MPERINEAVGANLRARREALGWNPSELARRARMHRSHIERIEDGSFKMPRPDTLRKLAVALNCEVDDLTGGAESIRVATPYESDSEIRSLVDDMMRISPADRTPIVEFMRWTIGRLPPLEDNVLEFVPFRSGVSASDPDADDFTFPITQDEFMKRDYDYPQPWHYWTKDESVRDRPAMAAGPRGKGLDDVHLLNPRGRDPREVFDRLNQIVRVEGDSMESEYFDGDLILIDTTNRNPVDGDPIAIYYEELGGSLLGFLKRMDGGALLVKKNRQYSDILLPESGWYLLGVVSEIVRRKARRERV